MNKVSSKTSISMSYQITLLSLCFKRKTHFSISTYGFRLLSKLLFSMSFTQNTNFWVSNYGLRLWRKLLFSMSFKRKTHFSTSTYGFRLLSKQLFFNEPYAKHSLWGFQLWISTLEKTAVFQWALSERPTFRLPPMDFDFWSKNWFSMSFTRNTHFSTSDYGFRLLRKLLFFNEL